MEVSKSIANEYIKAIRLCRSRLLSDIPEDNSVFATKGFRYDVDFNFFLISVNRFLRALELYTKVSNKQVSNRIINTAISEYKNRFPFTRKLRNFVEHFDDYLLNKGKDKTLSKGGLQVYSISNDWGTLEWMGYSIDINKIYKESRKLFGIFLKEYKKHVIRRE